MRKTTAQAFSLIELSIVIVIIGLMVVGITTSGKLIENANLKHDINKYEKLTAAIVVFNTTYNYEYPGDFSKAADYWGNNCNDAGSTDNCSGDGDGIVENGQERIRAWTHVSKAGLIQEDIYTGDSVGHGQYIFPRGKTASNLRFEIYSSAKIIRKNSAGFDVDQTLQNILFLGGEDNVVSPSWITRYSALTPRQAHLIDLKMDDGTPAGNLLGQIGHEYKDAGLSEKCVNSLTAYDLDETKPTCILALRLNSFIHD